MRDQIGFIGDVHGEVDLLERLLEAAVPEVSRVVFLGDYVNRGPRSRQVIDRLVDLKSAGVPAAFLAGNHDLAFLRVLLGGEIAPFLRIGGAATIASYVEEPITDPGIQLRQSVPAEHRAFLAELVKQEEGAGYVAAHHPDADQLTNERYGIFGHVPQRSLVPSIDGERALIDTGCGMWPEGRLTCFLWPSRDWFQVCGDSIRSE